MRDHNEKTPQELYEEQQFLKGFADIKSLRSEMAGTKGDIGQTYKRLKDLGWSKKDIEFAFTLEDKDVGQVIADFERKIRIARLMGHQLGDQLDLLDKDNTSPEDRAYRDGLRVGRLRLNTANPNIPGTPAFGRWEEGKTDGNSFVNKDLSAALNKEGGDE